MGKHLLGDALFPPFRLVYLFQTPCKENAPICVSHRVMQLIIDYPATWCRLTHKEYDFWILKSRVYLNTFVAGFKQALYSFSQGGKFTPVYINEEKERLSVKQISDEISIIFKRKWEGRILCITYKALFTNHIGYLQDSWLMQNCTPLRSPNMSCKALEMTLCSSSLYSGNLAGSQASFKLQS